MPTAPSSSPTEAHPAPVWRRLAALVYDTLLLLGLSFGYGLVVSLFHAKVAGRGGDLTDGWAGTAFQLGLLLIWIAFYVFFWRRGGQTLGMRSWRLRLITNSGEAVALSHCFWRCLWAAICVLPAGLGYWWAWLDRDGLALHDRLSQTVVVVLPKSPTSDGEASTPPEPPQQKSE